MPVIEVEHLHKQYRDQVAVDDLSFTVERGEIFGVLGPNGAGKTTTVEIIEGLRTPDGGTVRVLGLDPQRDRAELRRRVGAQLQRASCRRTGSGCWTTWDSPTSATPATASCRADRSSACPSPWPWSATPSSPSWTSSPAAWTPTRAATPGS